MRRRIELDQFEKDTEAHSSEYVPVSAAKRAKIEAILERARKTRNINIRISEYDLDRLKQRAEEEGMPRARVHMGGRLSRIRHSGIHVSRH